MEDIPPQPIPPVEDSSAAPSSHISRGSHHKGFKITPKLKALIIIILILAAVTTIGYVYKGYITLFTSNLTTAPSPVTQTIPPTPQPNILRVVLNLPGKGTLLSKDDNKLYFFDEENNNIRFIGGVNMPGSINYFDSPSPSIENVSLNGRYISLVSRDLENIKQVTSLHLIDLDKNTIKKIDSTSYQGWGSAISTQWTLDNTLMYRILMANGDDNSTNTRITKLFNPSNDSQKLITQENSQYYIADFHLDKNNNLVYQDIEDILFNPTSGQRTILTFDQNSSGKDMNAAYVPFITSSVSQKPDSNILQIINWPNMEIKKSIELPEYPLHFQWPENDIYIGLIMGKDSPNEKQALALINTKNNYEVITIDSDVNDLMSGGGYSVDNFYFSPKNSYVQYSKNIYKISEKKHLTDIKICQQLSGGGYHETVHEAIWSDDEQYVSYRQCLSKNTLNESQVIYNLENGKSTQLNSNWRIIGPLKDHRWSVNDKEKILIIDSNGKVEKEIIAAE